MSGIAFSVLETLTEKFTITERLASEPESSTIFGKTFPINIAFDHLTEDDYRKLRQWLNGKDRGELVFDEVPYKAYTVKIKDPP